MKKRRTDRPDEMTVFDIVGFPTPLEEIVRHFPEGFDLRVNLVRIGQNARRLLDEADTLPTYVLRDAQEALRHLERLQQAVEKKDGYSAVAAALYIGMIDERMRTRINYDQHIQRGRRVTASAGRSREKKLDKAASRHEIIRAEFLAARKRRGRKKQPTDTAIRARIVQKHAGERGYSLSAVLAATTNLGK